MIDFRADYKPSDHIFECAHEISSAVHSIDDRIEECDNAVELAEALVSMEEAREALSTSIARARAKMTSFYFDGQKVPA